MFSFGYKNRDAFKKMCSGIGEKSYIVQTMEWKSHCWAQSFLERNDWNFLKRRKLTQECIYIFFCFPPYCSIVAPLSPCFHSFLTDSTLFLTWQILWISYCREKLSCVCAPMYLWGMCLKSLVIFCTHKCLSCSIGPTLINHKKVDAISKAKFYMGKTCFILLHP